MKDMVPDFQYARLVYFRRKRFCGGMVHEGARLCSLATSVTAGGLLEYYKDSRDDWSLCF